jgi:electron transfer flavoprotein alpha subunit
MGNVLIVVEHQSGAVKKASLNALGAGRELAARSGGVLHALALGKGAAAAAAELRRYAPVLVAEAPVLDAYVAEAYAPVVADAAAAVSATYVGGAATCFTKDLLPRAAARLGAATATEVVGFAGADREVLFRRPMWAGNVLAEVELATPVKVFTLRATDFAPAEPAGDGEVTPLPVRVDAAGLKARVVELREVRSVRPDLTEARVVVSGGRGTKGRFDEVEACADDLGGAVGATRAAVDAGWAPNDWQVGQTGKVVAPELYIAAGISGAIQHVAGMKGAKVIVAINKDPEAPIFQVADYGVVADLFKALPELRAHVKAGRGA